MIIVHICMMCVHVYVHVRVCVCVCECAGLCMPCTCEEDREHFWGAGSLLLPCRGRVFLLIATMLCMQASWSVNFPAVPSLPPILLFGVLEFHILTTTPSVLVFFLCLFFYMDSRAQTQVVRPGW